MRRKSAGPKRSSTLLDDYLDPGVIFKIAANGQAYLCTSGLKRRHTSQAVEVPLESSESEPRPCSPADSLESSVEGAAEERTGAQGGGSQRKRCFSCAARKTPYWREGWGEGVVLCNACGIRFHKYRKYCLDCACIAKKDEHGRLHCPKCLNKL